MDIKVNFKIEVKDFVSYEFETIDTDIYIEEADFNCSQFRLFMNNDGMNEIFVANSEDYDIHEEVTPFFNVDDIIYQCKQEDKKGNVPDYTEDFKRDMLDRHGSTY